MVISKLNKGLENMGVLAFNVQDTTIKDMGKMIVKKTMKTFRRLEQSNFYSGTIDFNVTLKLIMTPPSM